QGEPTLDIPIDECPGEIGVICFQITVLPNKNDKEKNESDAKKEPKQEASKPSEAQKNTESTKQGEEKVPVSQPVANEQKKKAETVQAEVKETPVQEEKTTPEKKPMPNQPKGTQDLLSFDDIIVPEAFLKTRPNPEKTQKVIDFVKRTGRLDEPLTIEKGSNVLKDGYRRYIVAKTVKLDQVPVVYEYQK
ncbi:plasmid stabilization protein, partial [Priestia megaterium]|uniref:plasmid stabilization protein n=1 Tax=Priestia megaterium TaxID=1404 RepID=UPI002E1DB7B2|nr:plasmid stabilization protein [Priestia megaterium]